VERKQKVATKAGTPDAHLESQVFVCLLRTAESLTRGAEALLKSFGLSPAQYNVLRILRGGGECGLACREIAGRLISRDPDITRLLDRMESRGLIARAREEKDRRVVTTRITTEGLAILRDLDPHVQKLHHEQMQGLSTKQLGQLSLLLERIQAQAGTTDSTE
jgi:DNA-binding MarR family transcriptional regulator